MDLEQIIPLVVYKQTILEVQGVKDLEQTLLHVKDSLEQIMEQVVIVLEWHQEQLQLWEWEEEYHILLGLILHLMLWSLHPVVQAGRTSRDLSSPSPFPMACFAPGSSRPAPLSDQVHQK